MVSKSYVSGPSYKALPHLLNFTIPNTLKWVPALGLWGAAAGAGVLFFADSIPRLQRDVYQKIPVVGSYFDKSVPATDSPF
ncbi:hypothetical protein DV451_005085 [Geotrichum candidum]|uniref:Similar to Saccharomyces cerevisiae YHR001W-A QCR10 Subunit of the ubiqunol-cytochrome c oxidoreductase complex which includes Cobp, Rip1p, Cyt1p, Cor1p, Qcr2p,Qcr6p, Qcr7p, Qcr8p, Qcr9p, and Qcr10p n=1 Tax=Geotrichum candidum TaxID=1173061 RepID=A0A0J9X5S7_GEOCN|nr:hypothetical protein DV451_005085 [Geotrichum candidum]KAF5105079.1 hypothetical protein DV453_005074 [Geotrichum candidum]KAF5117763.1 hypothetical protein DV454_000857 [Geotrichum candidum]KAF5121453.1 hypothetical protein DV452_000814 [Geotrichum candidum]KAF7496844.1 hypothetical protein DV113_005120 [Geotrichum candidum]